MKTKKLVLTALFAALTCCGCFIQIPLPGGVPIVIQDMMAMLSGLILGPVYGGAAVLIFLILGVIGLPVFTGKAGLHVLLKGPTGGFLWGYLLAAIVGGIILHLLLGNGSEKKSSADLPQNAGVKPDENVKAAEKSSIFNWVAVTVAAFAATVVCFIAGIIGFKLVTHREMDMVLKAVLLPFIPGNIIKLAIMIPLAKKFRKIVWVD